MNRNELNELPQEVPLSERSRKVYTKPKIVALSSERDTAGKELVAPIEATTSTNTGPS